VKLFNKDVVEAYEEDVANFFEDCIKELEILTFKGKKFQLINSNSYIFKVIYNLIKWIIFKIVTL